MKTKKISLFIVIMLFMINSCSPQKVEVDINNLLTVEQQLEDFKFLKSVLKEACPILEVYKTKEEVNTHFNAIEKSITEPQRISDLFLKMGNALSFFNDGHLRTYIGNNYYNAAALEKSHIPIVLEFLNEKMYIEKNHSSYDLLKPKSEILSINGITSEKIISDFKSFHSSDGNNPYFKSHRMRDEFRSYLMYYFKFPKNYTIQIKSADTNEEKELVVEALTAATINAKKKPKKDEKKELFSIDYDDKRKVAIFRFTTFGDQDGEKQLRKIMKDLVKKCKKQGIETLIMDIRDNGGGFDGNAAVVYSYLTKEPFKALDGRYLKTKKLTFNKKYLINKDIEETLMSVPTVKVGNEFRLDMALDHLTQPNENVFTGEIYLLINRSTFSTATLFANVFSNHNRGIIVGQNSGGGYRGDSGGRAYIELPNSKILIQMPLVRNEYIIDEKHQDWITIQPDILVNLSIEDVLAKKDKVMEAVLIKINEKR